MANDLGIEGVGAQHSLGIGGGLGGAGGAMPAPRDADVLKEAKLQGLELRSSEAGSNATTFSEVLRDSVDKVNQFQHQADTAIKELVAGRSKNIHETMLAIERADASLKLMMQVRNKMLDAYKEIMRMQV